MKEIVLQLRVCYSWQLPSGLYTNSRLTVTEIPSFFSLSLSLSFPLPFMQNIKGRKRRKICEGGSHKKGHLDYLSSLRSPRTLSANAATLPSFSLLFLSGKEEGGRRIFRPFYFAGGAGKRNQGQSHGKKYVKKFSIIF